MTRSQLKEEEAAKHGDAAYRYLYKAAVGLLERQAWAQAAAACGAMLGAAGGDAAQQQRAVTAAGKLCAHMPSEEAAPAVAAVALQASSSAPGLSSGAALELLGLLCSAVQRAPAPAPPQLAETALSCAASSQPLLATAALLLPALVAQPFTERRSKGSSAAAAEWEHLTRAAIASVTDTIQQLEGSLSAGEPLPLGERQRQLAFLEAAFVPTNALRRVLAGQGGSGMAGSSATACRLAAAALEALAGMVGVASRVASDSAPSSLSSQGHAAAVALATAARLRAACTDGDPEPPCSSEAVCWLLGWDLASYCRDR